ncbi:MAG TPA: Rpn family recombination-promoting nuclease/putative transposase [Thermoanaerobaculia bacterium]
MGRKTRRPGNGTEHDSGYKLLFSHPGMVEELCRGFLPASWTARLDFASLEMAPTNFVSDGQQERRSDLIWKLRWKRGGDAYLLLEFQSTPDPSMPVRMFTYAGLLLQRLIREGALKSRGVLPTVLPVVLYLGRPSWRAPLDVVSLFGSRPSLAKRFLPQLRYILLDERRMDLDRPELADNLAAAVFRVETCETPEDFPRRVHHVLELLSDRDPELRRIVTNWLRRKVRRVSFEGIIFDLEDVTMLEETILEWEKQFLRRGRIEGMRRMLVRLMEERFGPLPSNIRRSLEAVSSPRKLERLFGQALKAESLAQVGLAATR